MHGDHPLSGHIGRIYDAALDPERWEPVLAELAALFRGSGAVLEGNDRRRSRFAYVWSAGLPSSLLRDYQAHFIDNPRVRFGARLKAPTVLHEPMFISEREMDREPYYAELLARYDLRYALAAVIDNTPSVTTGVAVQRPKSSGPPTADEIARFAPLGAHYRRALLIHAGLQRAEGRERALLDTLDRVAAAVALVGGSGRIMLTNRAADRLLASGDGLTSGPDGLAGRTAAATLALRRALAAAARQGRGGTVRLPRSAGRPLVAQAFPVAGETAERFGLPGPAAALMIVDPDEPSAGDPARLAPALDLSAKEAALVAALVAGTSLADVAAAEGASLAAVRKRLYRLFDKLGVRSQTALVRLALSVSLPK